MSLLVLAFPEISGKDFEWIQSVRKKDDERYFKVVEPHFTIVFPVSNIEEKNFIHHVNEKVAGTGEFYFVLRCAQVVKDSFSDYYDVFLIPEEGYRIFVKLHDKLYTDILANDLRIDIPFIPHLGIANSKDPKKCKQIADSINGRNLEIFGAVKNLDVVSYENNVVKRITGIPLLKTKS